MKERPSNQVDGKGDIYFIDKKELLRCPNIRRYRIAEGTEEIDESAFEGCDKLEVLYLPYTMNDEVEERLLDFLPEKTGNIVHWDRPYVEEVLDVNDQWYDEEDIITDEYGVQYTHGGRRLLRVSSMAQIAIGTDYRVPDGVLTICNDAFACRDYAYKECGEETPYLVLSAPRSIKSIGDNIFGVTGEGGRIEIRD